VASGTTDASVGAEGASGGASAGAGAAASKGAGEFWIPVSIIPPAPPGPPGLAPAFLKRAPIEAPQAARTTFPHHALDPERPINAHLFFGLYFCMTGLHGLHVLAGMGIIAWLAWRAIRREFGPDYYTPVDLGGLYWHIVDMIWIFLFPLLYLIA
jgi:cytochrome c oxidase subunit 3